MRLPDPCNRSLREGSDLLKAQLGHRAMHRSGKALERLGAWKA
jgi:hypothetical protein